MNEMREVKDLAIGDVVKVDGFDDNMTVRSAKKVKKGLDAGKLHVTLAAPDGEAEVVALDPEEKVKVVGKAAPGWEGRPKGWQGCRQNQREGQGEGQGRSRVGTGARACGGNPGAGSSGPATRGRDAEEGQPA